MLAWSEHVAGDVEFVPFEGDHFFIHSCGNDVVGKVRAIFEQAVVGGGDCRGHGLESLGPLQVPHRSAQSFSVIVH